MNNNLVKGVKWDLSDLYGSIEDSQILRDLQDTKAKSENFEKKYKDDFQNFVKDVAMHIAAANPQWLDETSVPESVIAHEKDIVLAQMKDSGKPEHVLGKIAEGKIKKFFEENCLLNQKFVKDPDKTIEQLRTEIVAKIGENIVIRRFARFELGGTK